MVVNSFASSVTARNKVLMHQTLSADHDVTIVETNRRGHATRFAQDAASRGIDVVVAVGGDGTLNEVANGLAGSATALAVLPGGSTNVFARTIGLPNDPVASAHLTATALRAGSWRRVGLGVVNGRYFTFHTGIGFDAAIVASVEKRASVKRWFGHPLFIYAGLRTWAVDYDRRRAHFQVSYRAPAPARGATDVDTGVASAPAPGADETIEGMFTIVLNTNPYTYLGNRPFDLVPGATLDAPLATVTFRRMSLRAMVPAMAGALRGGGLRPSDTVDVRTGITDLVVEHETPFPYQVDGDYLGETRRLVFRHAPDAMALVVPVPPDPAKADPAEADPARDDPAHADATNSAR